eukprot:494552-Rhodomonas_salina.1
MTIRTTPSTTHDERPRIYSKLWAIRYGSRSADVPSSATPLATRDSTARSKDSAHELRTVCTSVAIFRIKFRTRRGAGQAELRLRVRASDLDSEAQSDQLRLTP